MSDVKEVIEYSIPHSKESVMAWKNDPVTVSVLKLIKEEQARYSLDIGFGATLGEHIVQDTARAVGRVEGLEFLAELLSAKFNMEDDPNDGDDK